MVKLLGEASLYKPPFTISIRQSDRPGTTFGDAIVLEASHITAHPDDQGMLVHELAHVVQDYPHAPYWLIEGIADYVRYALGYMDVFSPGGCGPGESYKGGYACGATLLRFVENRFPGTVRRLQQRLRDDSFDGHLVPGVETEALWQLCQQGPCAAEPRVSPPR
ncbi:MAG: DUF4157 domain-containing protein [Deltaproteobacteria bacterium]|nr:DUF4157 domain-containing protein [Deltaproteobacteria bacterium]